MRSNSYSIVTIVCIPVVAITIAFVIVVVVIIILSIIASTTILDTAYLLRNIVSNLRYFRDSSV